MRKGRFIIEKSSDNQYYFTAVSKNGQVVATSELYTQKHNCHKGIDALLSITNQMKDEGILIVDKTL